MPTWIRAIFIGFGLLIAGGLGWLYVHGQMRTSEARHWPTTMATVIATDMERNESTSTSGSSSGRRSKTSVSWYPVVFPRYVVAGASYNSKNLYLNDMPGYGSEAEAQAFLTDYPVGRQFSLRYNPADPSDAAAIIEAPTWLILVFIGIGLILLAVGIFTPGKVRAMTKLGL
jgi:Protein of unknown function (DUF3592)